ncbi:hypothetical protein LOAG_15447 [Loa loa]|uniref:Uncharacterized protein n=1 Tax=Loa loa TaxID=7209 RepID=A0A1S0TH03_LOALO|nr:hypothetical protein LOAG_15447 [Loa loa]EFO13083.1 hypothetical protein LOAG_15447 [Loa loa]
MVNQSLPIATPRRFHQRCLRTILNIHWSDYGADFTVLTRAAVRVLRLPQKKSPKEEQGEAQDALKQYLSHGHIGYHQCPL